MVLRLALLIFECRLAQHCQASEFLLLFPLSVVSVNTNHGTRLASPLLDPGKGGSACRLVHSRLPEGPVS